MIIVYPVNTVFPSPRANTIQILNTANALAAAGNEVHLVARNSAPEEEIFRHYGILRDPGLKTHLVPAGGWLSSARGQESLVLKRAIHVLARHRSKPKIVFTRDPMFARILMNFRGLFRMRLVYEAHTLFSITARETYMPIAWSEAKEKRIRKRERFVFQNADGIVYISSSLKDFTARHFRAGQPSAVVHDGTNIPQEPPLAGKQPGVLCYSGQFYWWKGMSTLMESMRWVQGGILRMYGGGYSTVHDDMALMQKVIDEHGLQERIEFKGLLSPFQVSAALADCSIGILPLPMNVIGNHCNSPLKLFDYMAQGLAVVASDLLTIREIIDHGSNGHLVPPGNPKALADGINLVLGDGAYREKLARAAFETVRSYSWQERGRRLSQFLNSLP